MKDRLNNLVNELNKDGFVFVYSQSSAVTRHLFGLCSLGDYVQQIRGRDKVKPGECKSLGLQVLSQGLLTHSQPLL